MLRRGRFFLGGWLFAIGESWDWEEKEKYERRESAERAYINFCRRIHRQNYSVCDSVGYSDGKQGTTVWKFLFESLGDSVGMLNGESDTSPYGAVVLKPSVIPSVKSPAKTSTSMNNLFFYSEYFVCHSVGKYRRNDGCKKVHQ